jgi:CTP synthase (UTP-ammonia lyase)
MKRIDQMTQTLKIGIIGDFDPGSVSHVATNFALHHAAVRIGVKIAVSWLPTDMLEDASSEASLTVRESDALWCSPGGPYRSTNGALLAIRFARESGRPYIGT